MRLLRSPLEVELDYDLPAEARPISVWKTRGVESAMRWFYDPNVMDPTLLIRKSDAARIVGKVLTPETRAILGGEIVADYARAIAVSVSEWQGRGDGTDAFLAAQFREDGRLTESEAGFLEVLHADASLESLGVLVGRLFPASEATVAPRMSARAILARYGRRALSMLWSRTLTTAHRSATPPRSPEPRRESVVFSGAMRRGPARPTSARQSQ